MNKETAMTLTIELPQYAEKVVLRILPEAIDPALIAGAAEYDSWSPGVAEYDSWTQGAFTAAGHPPAS